MSRAETSQSIEWYHEGQARVVELRGFQVIIRFVGRKGRRARIAITAPPGVAFRSVELADTRDAVKHAPDPQIGLFE